MKANHSSASFIRYFKIYADLEFRKYSTFREIGSFANSLNFKANQLIKIANDEKYSDLYSLELALINCGKDFVGKFSERFRPHVLDNNHDKCQLTHTFERNDLVPSPGDGVDPV